MSARIEAREMQHVAHHGGLQQLQSLEDNVAHRHERVQRAIDAACTRSGKVSASARRLETAAGTRRTIEDTILLDVFVASSSSV